MIKRKSNVRLFSSLLVLTLILSAWLPTTLAETNPDLDEDAEIVQICDDEDFALLEEVLEDPEDIIEEEAEAIEAEAIEIEVLDVEDAPQETVVKNEERKEEEIFEEAPALNKKDEGSPEYTELKGTMPIIPLPKVGILSNGDGLEDTIEVDKTAQRLKGLCRQFEVKLDITGTPQEAPVDVVLIIDKSGSMNDTTSTYEVITSAPDTSKTYYVKINGNFQSVTHSTTQNRGWNYGIGNNRRFVSWDPSGDDISPGGININERVGKPFYTQVTGSRLYFAKQAAINFAGKVLGANGVPGSRVSLVTFNGPSSTSGNGNQNQAQTVRGLTSNLTQLTSDINGITAKDGTNTEAGFLQGRSVIENSDNPNSNKVVIMFTDGLPTASNGNRYAVSTDINHIHNQRAIAAGKGIFEDGVADVFTIGLLQGMSSAERNLALQILDLTQNKGWYEAPTAADLDQIFDDISTLLGYAATNAKVVDKIGDNFDLVPGSLPSGASYNSATREITWNPGTIVDAASLTYRVVAKQNAVGQAYTNEYANLMYTDVQGTPNQTKTFPKPLVDIPTLLEVELTDASIILGDSISLGSGTNASGENYMNIFGGDGDGTYTYEWRIKGSNTVISTDKNPSVSPTANTTYVVTVKDSNNCIATAEMTVEVRKLNVTVKKMLDGNYADFSDIFDFEMIIGDLVYTFALGHEETKTIEDVAGESLITLTEDAKDYEVTVKVGDDIITDIDGVYAIQLGNEDITITVTNYREADIETGINMDTMPYVLLMSSTFIGFGLYITIKRRKRN